MARTARHAVADDGSSPDTLTDSKLDAPPVGAVADARPKLPEPKVAEPALFDGPLPISHPTQVQPVPAAHPEGPVVTCDECKGWKRLHPKSAMGQCLPNSRYASGPIYMPDLGTCSNADPL